MRLGQILVGVEREWQLMWRCEWEDAEEERASRIGNADCERVLLTSRSAVRK